MVERVVHLGFEVRVELVRDDGEHLLVQLTQEEAEQLELERGQIVYVRPRHRRSSPGLMRKPGIGVGGDRGHLVGELARGEVGEGHGLQHGAQVRPNRDPDVA